MEVLNYFHMFRHPLYAKEIHRYINISVDKKDIAIMLKQMVNEGVVFYSDKLYALEGGKEIFHKRLAGAEMANKKIKEAYKSAKIISAFPFVKCVTISGSLSKGYANENSDIDFFIITANNRLWISRTLLHLFKKFTFLVNKQHSFCMNYFIDERALNLDEKNLFTATELSTLIPVYNKELYLKLIDKNRAWIKDFFPNIVFDRYDNDILNEHRKLKFSTEWVLNRLWPERFNGFLMNLTDKVWRAKWEKKNYPMEDYDLAMKTKWYVSKQHPYNYQKKVLLHNHLK